MDNLNQNSSKWFSSESKFSVDEMMVPYFGRHNTKQFIRNKPIRYGFKVRTNYMYIASFTGTDCTYAKIFWKGINK